MGNANKVVASPPLGDGLQAQSRSVPRLKSWVMRIKLLLHHLGSGVACEHNSEANVAALSAQARGGL